MATNNRLAAFSLKEVFLGFAIAAAVFTGARALDSAISPIFPRSVLQQLTPGLTKKQVQAIVGEPSKKYGENDWRYERGINPGWVEIQFDASGKLLYVNDESVYRP